MPDAERPTCIAIFLCDDTYRDARTGKFGILSAFNQVFAQSLPAKHPHLVVLFTLTNARGSSNLSVRLEHEPTQAVVAELTGEFQSTDPLGVVDIDVHLQGLVFPEAGKYWVVVESDGIILQQRPFFVQLTRPPEVENARPNLESEDDPRQQA